MSGITSIYDYLTYANTATNGAFFPLTSLTLWIVTFLYINKGNIVKSATASSFVTMLWSLVTWIAGLNSFDVLLFSIILTGLGMVYILAKGE